MVKFIPGLIAAIVGFLTIKLSAWALSLTAEFLIFVAIYIVVTFIIDAALKRYGSLELKKYLCYLLVLSLQNLTLISVLYLC